MISSANNNSPNRVFLCGVLVLLDRDYSELDAGTAAFGQGLPCVMGCRILLNLLREAAYKQSGKQSGPSTMANISTLKFAQRTTRRRTVRSALISHEVHNDHAGDGSGESVL